MGCICSKGTAEEEVNDQHEKPKENWNKQSSVQLIAPVTSKKDDFSSHKSVDGSSGGRKVNEGLVHKPSARASGLIVPIDDSGGKTVIVERPTRSHRRWPTADVGTGGGFNMFPQSNIPTSVPHSPEAELISVGWPSWLTSVAGEAIKGWVPRRAESFEKLDKVSSFYFLIAICFYCIGLFAI